MPPSLTIKEGYVKLLRSEVKLRLVKLLRNAVTSLSEFDFGKLAITSHPCPLTLKSTRRVSIYFALQNSIYAAHSIYSLCEFDIFSQGENVCIHPIPYILTHLSYKNTFIYVSLIRAQMCLV